MLGAQTPLWRALLLGRSLRLRVTAGGQYGALVSDGQLYRLVRSVWLHADALHLLVNVVSIVVIGRLLEPWVGAVRLWWWFVLGGVVGSVASQLAGLSQSDGASGGAFALFGALTLICWRARDRFDAEDAPLVRWWLPGFLLLNLVISFALPFVDGIAHLGGLSVGLLVGAVASPQRPARWVTGLELLGTGGLVGLALCGPLL